MNAKKIFNDFGDKAFRLEEAQIMYKDGVPCLYTIKGKRYEDFNTYVEREFSFTPNVDPITAENYDVLSDFNILHCEAFSLMHEYREFRPYVVPCRYRHYYPVEVVTFRCFPNGSRQLAIDCQSRNGKPVWMTVDYEWDGEVKGTTFNNGERVWDSDYNSLFI